MDKTRQQEVNLKRRNVLKSIGIITGYTLTVGATAAVMHGCKADTSTNWSAESMTTDQLQIVAEACERIIPKTDTPGAKDAMVERYIDNLMANILDPKESQMFTSAIPSMDVMSREKYKKKFVSLSDTEKDDILTIMSEQKRTDDSTPTLFEALKSFTVAGYYTSEVGANSLNYLPVPGPYEGCVTLESVGGTTWAL